MANNNSSFFLDWILIDIPISRMWSYTRGSRAMLAAKEAWEVGQADTTRSFVSRFAKTLVVLSDPFIRAYHRNASWQERPCRPISRPTESESRYCKPSNADVSDAVGRARLTSCTAFPYRQWRHSISVRSFKKQIWRELLSCRFNCCVQRASSLSPWASAMPLS